MPYRRGSEPERLPLPSNPEYWVDMKRRPTRGDRMAAQDALISVVNIDTRGLTAEEMRRIERDPDDQDTTRGLLTDYRYKAYLDTWLLRLISAWNIDRSILDPAYEGEEIAPITQAAIDALDDEDGQFLLHHARKRMKANRPDPTSNGQSRGSSTGMRSDTPLPSAQ